MSARANVKKLAEKLADAAQALEVAEREQAQLVRSGDESAWQDARRSVAFCRGYHGGLEDALALIQGADGAGVHDKQGAPAKGEE